MGFGHVRYPSSMRLFCLGSSVRVPCFCWWQTFPATNHFNLNPLPSVVKMWCEIYINIYVCRWFRLVPCTKPFVLKIQWDLGVSTWMRLNILVFSSRYCLLFGAVLICAEMVALRSKICMVNNEKGMTAQIAVKHRICKIYASKHREHWLIAFKGSCWMQR